MKKLLIGALLACTAISAQAIMITDDQFLSNGTQVNLSGLEWLSLDYTQGMAYEQAVAAGADTIEGGGWRVASAEEAGNLFDSLGWSDASGSGYPSSSSLDWWGSTFGWTVDYINPGFPEAGIPGSSAQTAHAMFGLPDAGDMVSSIYAGCFDSGISGGCSYDLTFMYSIDDSLDSLSTLLVRDAATVPEPSIIWLLGSGLVLIGIARRKK